MTSVASQEIYLLAVDIATKIYIQCLAKAGFEE